MHRLLQLRLRLGEQFAHGLDARIEISHPLLGGGVWGGLRGRNSITMTTMTPIAIIVPMASVRAAACAKSVLARICKSDMCRFYSDSPGKRTNGER